MTDTDNILNIIERYKIWLTSGIWSSVYFKSKWHWKSEIKSKIKELELKLKHDTRTIS